MENKKIKFTHKVNYNEVDKNLNLRVDTIFGYLQYAAISHSEQVGSGTEYLKDLGYTWVMAKIQIEIYEYPTFGDNIEILTWSLGAKSFLAIRDFELKKGEKVFAKATSLWYLINLEKRKIVKIPEDIIKKYNSLKLDPNFDNLEKKRFDFEGDISFNDKITLRYSDFDSNGHVNNTAYFNYIQTGLFNFKGKLPFIESISCQFLKEIPEGYKSVNILLSEKDKIGKFLIRDDKDFCIGEYKIRG